RRGRRNGRGARWRVPRSCRHDEDRRRRTVRGGLSNGGIRWRARSCRGGGSCGWCDVRCRLGFVFGQLGDGIERNVVLVPELDPSYGVAKGHLLALDLDLRTRRVGRVQEPHQRLVLAFIDGAARAVGVAFKTAHTAQERGVVVDLQRHCTETPRQFWPSTRRGPPPLYHRSTTRADRNRNARCLRVQPSPKASSSGARI